jgi:hypothetical protein
MSADDRDRGEDRLLRSLGTLAREQDAEQPPAALLPPLHPAAHGRLVDEILGTAVPAPRPLAVATEGVAVRAQRRLGRWLAALLVPAAVAAGATLWLHAAPPPLPGYEATVTGGVSETRSAPPPSTAPILLDPGSPLEVVLRPQTEVPRSLEARAFWARADDLRPWTEAEVDHSPRGAFRFRGRAPRPFGPGPGHLVLVVAPPGQLPATIDASSLRSPPRVWRVVRQPVHWR